MASLPPMSAWKFNVEEGLFFPTFPQILADVKKYGKILSYEFPDRRITILADPTLYETVFNPGQYATTEEGKSIRMDMDRVGWQIFNIPKDILVHQRAGLDGLRIHALNPKVCGRPGGLNDVVGEEVRKCMDALPSSGEMNLLDVACFTFPGVNRALFGKDVVPKGAESFFFDFDECVAKAAFFSMKDEQYYAAHAKIERMFMDAIERGAHLGEDAAPGIAGRLQPLIENGVTDSKKLADFLVSIFWAPQANTLPMTYWTLAYVLSNPEWFARVRAEADAVGLGSGGRFHVDPEDGKCLPFTRACMNEVLRLYLANVTIRHVEKDIELTLADGQKFTVPKGDKLYISSYLTQYDGRIFPEPEKYIPERWLDKNSNLSEDCCPANHFIPFSKGRFSCSGRHLLHLELPTLVAMFVRNFDAELIDPIPEAGWDYVAASVRPKGWPHNFPNKIKFLRRKASKL